LKRPPDIIARYGGEEFVILLPGTNTGGAVTLAETIRARLEEATISNSTTSINLTASLGVCAAVPTDLDDPEWILRKADKRLYRAKHGGRNRVEA
jgi:diguanylate cyclase